MDLQHLISALVFGALVLYPLLRICARAGLPRWPAILVLIPTAGPLIVAYLLAFSRWPKHPHGA